MEKLKRDLSVLQAQIESLDPKVSFANGGFWLVSDEEFYEQLQACFYGGEEPPTAEYSPETHFIVNYDFWTDELNDVYGDYGSTPDKNKFDHLFNRFEELHADELFRLLSKRRCHIVDEVDGSGNGLYYGGLLCKRP